MSFFTQLEASCDLGNGNKVHLRKLTYGVKQRVTSRSSGFNPVTRDIQLDYPMLRMRLLQASLVGWEGPDFEGTLCTPENFELLPDDIVEKIEKTFEELNAPMDPEAKKTSSSLMNTASSAASSEDSLPSPQSS